MVPSQRFLSMALWGTDWVIVALAVLSFGALFVAVLEAITLLRSRSNLDQLLTIIVTRLFSDDDKPLNSIRDDIATMHGMEANILRKGIDRSSMGPATVEELITGLVGLERIKLERGIFYLWAVGLFAPFIGLFGTVLGLMSALHEWAMTPTGGPALIMMGLTEALIPVGVGLMVSIPTLASFYYFRRRIMDRVTKLDAVRHLLLAGMKNRR